MTESFATAMVTVIPIILLVAVVEVQQRGRLTVETLTRLRLAVEAERGGDPTDATAVLREARMSKPPALATFLWGVLCAAHVVAELILIFWLAGSERPPGTWQASFVAYTAAVGFVLVILVAVLSPYFQAARIRAERRPRSFL
ncbi:hypothetical protein [Streptomyces sp. NPDC056512]|uniref:hypothetical protein n=1 Tax=Streptomyces sp. NPDC056512 TaxID=3345846 RepID=UPI0036A0A56E